MSKSSAKSLAEPTESPLETTGRVADALCRAAAECARQHERLGRCLEMGSCDEELHHLGELTALADGHLVALANRYEETASAATESKDAPWRHAANALWMASREYSRRADGTNRLMRLAGRHPKEKLTELTLEYELERSALMALKQNVAAYRSIRPAGE